MSSKIEVLHSGHIYAPQANDNDDRIGVQSFHENEKNES